MAILVWIILFCLIGGILSVSIAAAFLLIPESLRIRLVPHFVSFAIGALLGGAFLALLPHAMGMPGVEDLHPISFTVLVGLLLFFLLEKLLLWRHCHTGNCEAHGLEHMPGSDKPAGVLILLGDGLHNLVDGVLIAGAFLTDIHLGIVTTLAIAAHEIPQEVGDFIILLDSGFGRGKALLFNILSSLATVVGGVLAYFSLTSMEGVLAYVLAIGAASFIYIAVADLIPSLHKRVAPWETVQQFVLIVSGVTLIYISHSMVH